jgi:sugar/nucleoside kinase (ribokinase family)
VVKLGARGCLVDGRLYPARPIRPVDTTGAGDAFAAGGLLDGPALALQAAGRCVAKLAAMP